jgi:hypothetical protein
MGFNPPPRQLPPKGTRLHGKQLWSAVLDRYDLEQQEFALLREIVRSVDELDDLAAEVSRHGAVSPRGVLNPAVSEARQMRVALAALLSALRLPSSDGAEDDEASMRRPRRYPAVRRIDPPAPRSDATSVSPSGRHHFADGRSGKATGISVAELITRIGEGSSAEVSA